MTVNKLDKLRQAAAECENCPLFREATQTVFGEGTAKARLMLVGEQPGDREDQIGRPFIGPAGSLLRRAIRELGWPEQSLYLTNAVKHFKHELRGVRRIHKTPAQREIAACRDWLEAEIQAVDPEGIVALGATAARALLGAATPVMRESGDWKKRADGRMVLIALHPSALLRADPGNRAEQYRLWRDDLGKASRMLA